MKAAIAAKQDPSTALLVKKKKLRTWVIPDVVIDSVRADINEQIDAGSQVRACVA